MLYTDDLYWWFVVMGYAVCWCTVVVGYAICWWTVFVGCAVHRWTVVVGYAVYWWFLVLGYAVCWCTVVVSYVVCWWTVFVGCAVYRWTVLAVGYPVYWWFVVMGYADADVLWLWAVLNMDELCNVPCINYYKVMEAFFVEISLPHNLRLLAWIHIIFRRWWKVWFSIFQIFTVQYCMNFVQNWLLTASDDKIFLPLPCMPFKRVVTSITSILWCTLNYSRQLLSLVFFCYWCIPLRVCDIVLPLPWCIRAPL